jgi:hypothetical protein
VILAGKDKKTCGLLVNIRFQRSWSAAAANKKALRGMQGLFPSLFLVYQIETALQAMNLPFDFREIHAEGLDTM